MNMFNVIVSCDTYRKFLDVEGNKQPSLHESSV